ncbi:MAG: NAD(P)-binding protein [Clostridiales bacterium]|nr:NAD(P)-binding protein [Clostridiales bacterium]
MIRKDALVIGLGISGCSAARLLAESGYTVTCFESESYIGGSLFEEVRPNGIRVQSFGPQVFHTDSEAVFQFIKRFGAFFPYNHRVYLSIQNKMVPLPLNANSLQMIFGNKQADTLLARISSAFPGIKRVSVDRLMNSHDSKLLDLGRFMLENILTRDINRKDDNSFVPADDSFSNDAYVDIGNDDCYYTDSIQAMPMQGFMSILEHMIDHQAISVFLNTNALSRISIHQDNTTVLFDGVPFKGPIIYTPSLDKLFHYCYGSLPYRKGRISFQDIRTDFQNDCAVILTPKNKEVIRITESKYMTLQDIDGHTSLMYEAPYVSASKGNGEPFEPVINEESKKMYEKYEELAKACPSIHLLGRMACYRNQSISDSIEQAIDVVSRL